MSLLHERIAAFAAANPDKIAVADAQGEMTYGELEKRGKRVASALRALGVRTGDAVAILVPYGCEIVVGITGALFAGGVFVPLDDAYPEERLAYILEDAEAKAVLTVRSHLDRLGSGFPAGRCVLLDELSEPPAAAGDDMRADVSEDSPAMLLYTSGTTGRPKGVLHTHRMLVHIVDWMRAHEGVAMDANTVSGVISSFAFVGTQMFLLGPLGAGGTVRISPEAARVDIDGLHRFLQEGRVTHIFVPAALAAILAEDFDIRGTFVFAAGERLRQFKPFCEGNVLYNSYGMTETSGVCAMRVAGNEERILVGRPYRNTRVCVCDEGLAQVAPGEAGELLVTNDYMSRQYYKLPDLSAKKWVTIDGTLWFRTGDRARITPAGDIDLLGRVDNMVKLRGFRIETGEVETQIAQAVERLGLEGVRQIVVVARRVGGTDHLVCYYEAPSELDRSLVAGEAARYLADYMVPDIWVRMDAFPKNANGKVMRDELPQPPRFQHLVGALDSEVLARVVWAAGDVLGTEDYVGPDDRFTDLGGTSLSAMRLSAVLRTQGIKVSSAEVLRLNVLRDIAAGADVAYEQLWTPQEYDEVRAAFAERGEHIEKVLPITSAQDDMLFTQLILPDHAHLRDVWFLQVDSEIEQAALREALDVVAAENEELRSAIVFRDVSVVQQVILDRKVPVETVEFESASADELARLRAMILDIPYDLEWDSLLTVVSVGMAERRLICIVACRIAFDEARMRGYLARLMGLLARRYPSDTSLADWADLFEMGMERDREEQGAATRRERPGLPDIGKGVRPEICVYSENVGPKVVFVHTGNTGSEAYYRLAARIADRVSFSVIEPYNLYHPDEAVYGIDNIAARYVSILRRHQPEGPYILGGWCYGGMVAHEMACQLEAAGEDVRHLFMLDSHAVDSTDLRKMSASFHSVVTREYFETSPLFADLREMGMLEAVVNNAAHVSEDMMSHVPSHFHGNVTYFKPMVIPAGVEGDNRRYWERMMKFNAGNYEKYCDADRLKIVKTPHEHDLMMDDASLDIIVPVLLADIEGTAE